MRINQFLAQATNLSRRGADDAVTEGRVQINGQLAVAGQNIADQDVVLLDGQLVMPPAEQVTIMLHKPVGYVCSRNGQGSSTIYDLLPGEYATLNPVGRLDKDSSGLLLLTNDGHLAHQLTHPSFQKEKRYEVTLDQALKSVDLAKLEKGVQLPDGPSHLLVTPLRDHSYEVRMHEGRNRQIRRTFEALGYHVTKLHRTHIGPYALGKLPVGKHQTASTNT